MYKKSTKVFTDTSNLNEFSLCFFVRKALRYVQCSASTNVAPYAITFILCRWDCQLLSYPRKFLWLSLLFNNLVYLLHALNSYQQLPLADLHKKFSGVHPPYGTQFFHFHIHFHRKAPMSEVHAPQNGFTPPYWKSWIRPWLRWELEHKNSYHSISIILIE